MVKMKLAWIIFLGCLGLAAAALAAEPTAPDRAARSAFTAEQLIRPDKAVPAALSVSSWKELPSTELGVDSMEDSFRMTSVVHFNSAAIMPALPQEEDEKLPGRSTVFFKSLLLPGWGQHSLGAKTSARNFLIAEAVLWGVVIGSQLHGTNLAEDYKAMAAGHASVRGTDKDSRYWVDVGNFDSIFDYNQAKLQQRSIADLRDPQGDEYWFWNTTANRTTYENLRVRSDAAYERRDFAVAAVITNHLISAIHAMWVHRKRTSPQDEAASNKDIGMNLLPDGRGGQVYFSLRF